jgi:putative nucleotidyltransferase with HDIG domain
MFRVPALLKDFSSVLTEAGFQCWLVGGATRDMALGKEGGDFDVATDARPQDVMRIFRAVIPTGIEHGTVTVRFRGVSIETTTFRTEAGYSDGRHPDAVEFSTDIAADLSRRDFTMNALALDCRSGKLLDLHGGLADLKAKIVRAIGDPDERFGEDGLRPLRAIRFASVLGFSIEEKTLAAIPRAIGKTALVSTERIRDELSKILIGPDPMRGLRLLEDSGLLPTVLPELLPLRGLEQSSPHAFDGLDHSYRACAAIPARLELRLAGLFHDAGKPATKEASADGVIHFFGHEKVSADIAKKALIRLKYPSKIVESASHLIIHHMTRYDGSWTDAAVRRFISRVGPENVDDVLFLLESDERALNDAPYVGERMREFRDRIDAVLAQSRAFGVKDLALSGDDLRKAGISPGPAMGRVLKELLETVLDDPEMNTPELLTRIALSIKERDGL